MTRLKSILIPLFISGSLLTFGCESVEDQPKTVVKRTTKILPADGLPDSVPLMAGLALTKERLKQCQTFEQKRAREGKWPSIIVPENFVKLRSESINAHVSEVNAEILTFNFNVGEKRHNGCFINAYQSNSDNTVTDYATGLMWMDKPSAAYSRSEAKEYIRKLNQEKFAGYSDWRLPTTVEMASLIDWHRYGKRSYVDPYFFRRPKSKYMTADIYRYEGIDRVWMLRGFARSTVISNSIDEPAHVLAVRSHE